MKNITYYNAGAGSGKTYRLNTIITDLILNKGVKPEELILTTFTKKAAHEFREKAKAMLYQDRRGQDAASRLDQALIGTVHSVCQQMIGKYWYHLGLAPDMNVLTEDDTQFYIKQSLADLPNEKELRFMRQFAHTFGIPIEKDNKKYGINENFWKDHLKKIIDYATSYGISDFSNSKQESIAFIKKFLDSSASISISDEELTEMLNEARDYVKNSNRIKNKDGYYNTFDEIKNGSRNQTIAWYASILSGIFSKYGPTCDTVTARLSHLWHSPEIFNLQEKYIALIFELATRWQKQYEQFKREKGLIDYNDMEKYMYELLQNKDVCEEISQSFHYLFVDEFQDSSPIQVKIFDKLSELMVHSWWVGDFKQAIYGFRGSDTSLTHAVMENIKAGRDNCTVDTLGNCYRSLPDIVNLTGDLFTKTFTGVLREDEVKLVPQRKNTGDTDSLRYVRGSSAADLANHIALLLHDGIAAKDIAVLMYTHEPLNELSVELKKLGIASNRPDGSVNDSLACKLVLSLLRIVDSSHNLLARAQAAFLTEESTSTSNIIEAKLALKSGDDSTSKDFLADIPIIANLLKIRKSLRNQSVATITERIIVELNLYQTIKRIEPDPDFGISCLQVLISSARKYEDYCFRLGHAATIDGFIEYISQNSPQGFGDPDGIQLVTCHSSKGLEWKHVIIGTLNKNFNDEKTILAREVYGVQLVRSALPTPTNLYPSISIRLLPWIFGTKKHVPDDLAAVVMSEQEFKDKVKEILSEKNRLMYVSMTRASDVLTLYLEEGKKFLQWFKDIGLDINNEAQNGSGDIDIFGNGYTFKPYTIPADWTPAPVVSSPTVMVIDAPKPCSTEREERYVSPSKAPGTTEVKKEHNFRQRIPLATNVSDMAAVGDCIHHIYAGIEESRSTPVEMDKIISSHGLSNVLNNPEAIQQAWDNLTEFLITNYGPAISTYHERAFRLEKNGQTFVGSIDLVWQTEKGNVLLDYKTCPKGESELKNPASKFYAGHYGGQLSVYRDALEAASESVIATLVYYPVSGILMEL